MSSEDLKVGIEFDAAGLLKLQDAVSKVDASQKKLVSGMQSGTAAIGEFNKSSGMMANGLRTLPAQLSDITVQLTGGQSPFLVMLQQGSQIRDSFGGIGAAIRGIGSVLTPSALGIGAVVTAVTGFAFAAYQGMKEAESFRNMLALTGNAAGLTGSTFNSTAASIAASADTGIGKGKDALLALANAGVFTGQNLQLMGENALRMSTLTGQSLEDIAKDYARMPEGVAKWALEHNKSMNFMTLATYQYVKALEDQGRAEDAMTVLQSQIKDRLGAVKEDLGTIQSLWRGITDWTSRAYDAAKRYGSSDQVLSNQISNLEQKVKEGEFYQRKFGNAPRDLDSNRQQLAALKDQEARSAAGAYWKEEQARIQKAAIAAAEYTDGLRAGYDKAFAKAKEIAKAQQAFRDQELAGSPVAADQQRAILDGIRDKYKATIDPATQAYNGLIKGIRESTAALELQDSQVIKLTSGQERQIKIYADIRDGVLKLTDAQKIALTTELERNLQAEQSADISARLRKEHQDYIDSLSKSAATVDEQAAAIERQVAAFGLGNDAVTAQIIANLELQKTELELSGEVIPGTVRALEKQIDAYKRLRTAQSDLESKESVKKAAEDLAAEYKRITGDIERSLTDAILRSGQGGAKGLKDYLSNYFKTFTIRLTVQPVVGAVTGAIGAALGVPSSGGLGSLGTTFGGLAASIGGGLAGMPGLGNLYTVGSSLPTALNSGFAVAGEALELANVKTADAIGRLFGLKESLGTFTSTFSEVIPYLGSITSVLSGDVKGGILSGIGTYLGTLTPLGPLGGAIGGFIGSALGSFFGGGGDNRPADSVVLSGGLSVNPVQTGIYAQTVGPKGFYDSVALPEQANQAIKDALGAVTTGIKSLAERLGVRYQEAFQKFSVQGNSLTGTSVAIGQDITPLVKELLSQVSKSLTESVFGDVLAKFKREGESTQSTVERLSASLGVFDSVMASLGKSAQPSIEALDRFSTLLEAFGGQQGFAQAVNQYEQLFLSESERLTRAQNSLQKSFSALGQEVPKTKEQFRALIESLDLTTANGLKMYAALLSLAPSFATVVDKANELKSATGQLVESLQSVAAKFGELAGVAASSVYSQLDGQIALSQKAASSARDLAAEYRNLASSLTADAQKIRLKVLGGSANNAATAFDQTYNKAISGDRLSMGALGSVASDYLAFIESTSSSTKQFILKSLDVAQKLDEVASVATVAGVGADYQSQLYDVNAAALEVLKESLSGENLTLEAIKEQTQALESIQRMIVDSAQLMALVTKNASGSEIAALQDASGRTIATLSFGDAQNISAIQGQNQLMSLLSGNQISGIGSSISGQTITYTGLQSAQINQLAGLSNIQTQTRSLTSVVADATDGSETLLGAVLNRLTLQDKSSVNVISAIQSGNAAIIYGLYQIEAAVRQQASEVAAERARKQQLDQYQADLETLSQKQSTLIGTVNQGIAGIFNLANSYGVFLNANQGASQLINDAVFKVNSQGLFESQYNQISFQGDGSNVTSFKNAFYANGGVYDQTFGQAGGLQDIALQIQQKRDLIRALGGTPQFANGGDHLGGYRIVGEFGPELEATGPSRIFSAQRTKEIFSSAVDSAKVERKLDAIDVRLARLEAINIATATKAEKTADILNRVSDGGQDYVRVKIES